MTTRSRTVSTAAQILFVLSLTALRSAYGQEPADDSAPAIDDRPSVRFELRGGVNFQFESDLDDGGAYDVETALIEGSVTFLELVPDSLVGLSLGYRSDRFDFSGSSGFAGLQPWEDLRTLSFGASIRSRLDDKWTLFVAPSVRFATEDGVDLDDGLSGGVIAGASYKVNDRLTIGPGVGVQSRIEDDVSAFPILLVDWAISETVSLRTARGIGASRGPGIELVWDLPESLSLTFGGRYERQRYRLDDVGAAPEGVAERRSLPLYAALGYEPTPDIRVSLIAGVSLESELRLEDRNGILLTADDADPAPFIGLFGSVRF